MEFATKEPSGRALTIGLNCSGLEGAKGIGYWASLAQERRQGWEARIGYGEGLGLYENLHSENLHPCYSRSLSINNKHDFCHCYNENIAALNSHTPAYPANQAQQAGGQDDLCAAASPLTADGTSCCEVWDAAKLAFPLTHYQHIV